MFYKILLVLPFLFLAHLIRCHQRLRHVPGPFLASVSKFWQLQWVVRGALHVGLFEACQQYGHVVRIGPNEVVTDDPEIIRRINAVRSPYKRGYWYNATSFDHGRNHVFCERDEVRHMELRNQMLPGYSGKENLHLESSMDRMLLKLLELIREKYLSSPIDLKFPERTSVQPPWVVYRPVDFARIAQYFALDVISDIAFGRPFGFLETDSDVHDYIKTQKSLLPVFEWFSTLPLLERLTRIRWISKMLMPKPTDRTGLGQLMGVAGKIVEERYAGANKENVRSDMLGSFIRHGLPQEQAKVETVLQIMAGSDTTVTALRMTILLISTAPSILSNVLAELGQAEEQGKLSSPIAREGEIRAHLPYLCACIKETLRVWPPVVGLGFKEVPDGGDTVGGVFLPQGTLVGYNAWSLHRSKEIYGDDANLYRPGRWTDTRDEEKLAAMTRSAELVFSHGKNGCLGKPVALMELHKAVTELLRRFDFSLVDPTRPIHSLNRNGLFVQSDMWVRISTRTTRG